MATMYYEKDINRELLQNKTIAIIGYGSQGHAHAQNLRDSGFKVIVANRAGSANARLAEEHGFTVHSAEDAARQADVMMILLPDEIQARVYKNDIAPHLTAGKMLLFAHGFNIHFGQIVPPANVDVAMIAPKGPGHLVRSEFEKGGGVACLIAVHQNPSGQAKDLALAYALGLGGARAGIIETTFKEETETDLFGEQAVLCGGASELIRAGYQTLTDAGYQPEIAYFEVMHELKLIVDLFYQGGLAYMNYSVSNTAEYGGQTRGPRVVNETSRQAMREILEEIQNGSFAREWLCECLVNQPVLKKLRDRDAESLLEKTGAGLRRLMPFVKPKEVQPDGGVKAV
ncbi:ketol-acid reductoisomerase (NADP(+)) [Planctomycetales bacterium]|nr:ketol-acid reductoisomerase (NADP(+)) [Planctomycetales bacterium]GHT07960.1 ketol-acid reductoisomerase (NADP(+)) [Planctomycetales bacterium]